MKGPNPYLCTEKSFILGFHTIKKLLANHSVNFTFLTSVLIKLLIFFVVVRRNGFRELNNVRTCSTSNCSQFIRCQVRAVILEQEHKQKNKLKFTIDPKIQTVKIVSRINTKQLFLGTGAYKNQLFLFSSVSQFMEQLKIHENNTLINFFLQIINIHISTAKKNCFKNIFQQ